MQVRILDGLSAGEKIVQRGVDRAFDGANIWIQENATANINAAEEQKTKVSVRFGHVKSFRHSTTLEYFEKRVWRLGHYTRLHEPPKWIAAETNSGIQLADMYAGILHSAMIADKFGNFEVSYLETIKHQIRASSKGKISGYGIKAISSDSNPKTFKWWPKGWV